MKEKTNAEVAIKCMASLLAHNQYHGEMSNGDSLHTPFMAPIAGRTAGFQNGGDIKLHVFLFLFLKFSGEGISTGGITPYYLCSAPLPSSFIFPNAA